MPGTRLPVQFRLGDNPIDQVLGVPTSEPLANAAAARRAVAGQHQRSRRRAAWSPGPSSADGVANSFEAHRAVGDPAAGDEVVHEGFATAAGWMDDAAVPLGDRGRRLGSRARAPTRSCAMTVDASGGAEGPGPYADTRTIVVE